MFHEMSLKLYFMKCLERKISQCIHPLTQLNVKIGEHIAILPIKGRKAKPKNSSIRDQVSKSSHSPLFGKFI